MTISGSGFGTKSPAKPRIWADFENGSINPSPKGQFTTWTADSTEFKLISTGTAYGDSTAMAAAVIGSEGGAGSGAPTASFQHDLNVWTTVYLVLNRRWTYDSTSNHKIFRLWPSEGTNDYVVSTIGQSLNECDEENPDRWVDVDFAANTWYHERWFWQHGHGGTSLAQFYQNGRRRFNQSTLNNCDNDLIQLRVADNFCSDCPAAESQVFQDNIYVDSTFSRVEISTTATYSLSTNLKPLLLQTWSDTEIKGELFLGDLSSNDTLYAYVTDAQNNTNANGVEMTEDGGAPAAPTQFTYPQLCPCR